MKAVSRKDYIDKLGKLPIENPIPKDMALVCPHLTQKQAVTAFELKGDDLRSYVACPPVRVRGAFQIIDFTKEGTYPRLRWASTSRIRESYEDKKSCEDIFHSYKWMDEAISYAEKHWGDELVLDDWASHIIIHLQNPKTKMVEIISFAVVRKWNDIFHDYSKPKSEVINDSIIIATLNNMFEENEIEGGRVSYMAFNCACCGAALGLNGCVECKSSFPDGGWTTPLPKKLVDLLNQNGHIFEKDPAIAQQRELKCWTADHSRG